MIDADSRRLLRAFTISIVFHFLLFLLMGLFDWFPETDNLPLYDPVTVTIGENLEYSPSAENIVSEGIPPVEAEPSEVEEISSSPEISTGKSEPSLSDGETASLSIPNAYDDLFIQEEENSPQYVPVTDAAKSDKPFVPGDSRIELESGDNSADPKNYSQDGAVQEERVAPVVSESELSTLEESFTQAENTNTLSAPEPSDAENSLPLYMDENIKFEGRDVNRTLVSSKLPVIPDGLPLEFPSEMEYSIRFKLYADGVMEVLSITPSSVYPSIDASIRNALRSWMFNGSPGSEPVEGTITITIKVK